MTKEKVLNVINLYDRTMSEYPVTPADYPHGVRLLSRTRGIAHCLAMLPKMRQFIEEDRMDKAFRWLGFLQGAMWAFSLFTLEELMNHNRPDGTGTAG